MLGLNAILYDSKCSSGLIFGHFVIRIQTSTRVTQILTPVLTPCDPMDHVCHLNMRFRCVFAIGFIPVCDLVDAMNVPNVIREWSIKPTTQILLM